MTARELVLREAPSWSEEQAERALQASHAENESESLSLDTHTGRVVTRVMHDLAEVERAELGETIAEAWGYERRTRRAAPTKS